MRRNVIKRLLKHRNLICQNDDLIRSDEQGYYLREWVTTADGTEMMRNYPMKGKNGVPGEEEDHSNHRSLYFTHGDVNGKDFWRSNAESHQNNQIVQREFVTTESGKTGKMMPASPPWCRNTSARRACGW